MLICNRHNIITRIFIPAVLIISSIFAVACSDKKPAPSLDEPLIEASDAPEKVSSVPLSPARDPIPSHDEVYEFDDGEATFPVLEGKATDSSLETAPIINAIIEDTINDLLLDRKHITSINYTEYYNDNGIYSILLSAYYPDEDIPYVKTLTFDCDTGELITIDKLFSENDNTWRRVISDLIMQASGTPFLSDQPPIDNDRMFYLTDTRLVIIYQLYEISIYTRGTPCFYIEYSKIQDFFSTDSLLKRIMDASSQNT